MGTSKASHAGARTSLVKTGIVNGSRKHANNKGTSTIAASVLTPAITRLMSPVTKEESTRERRRSAAVSAGRRSSWRLSYGFTKGSTQVKNRSGARFASRRFHRVPTWHAMEEFTRGKDHSSAKHVARHSEMRQTWHVMKWFIRESDHMCVWPAGKHLRRELL